VKDAFSGFSQDLKELEALCPRRGVRDPGATNHPLYPVLDASKTGYLKEFLYKLHCDKRRKQ
jgi:hypothetical protein